MKHYLFALLISLFQFGFSQVVDTAEANSNFYNTTVKFEDKSSFVFKDYGELWFSTLESLIELGEIDGFDEQPLSVPVLIFPDTTIYQGYTAAGTFVPTIHGVADLVNPTTLPTDYTKEWYWAKSVIDSIAFPYAYFRNTEDSIKDTVFVDYLNHISFTTRLGHIPLDGDTIPDLDEFFHQPILHTGETDELDSGMVFKTDTIILSADDETPDFAKLIGVNTNDTVNPGERYGVYLRFKPGYEWNRGDDTLYKYNQFGVFMREQDEGERPRLLWDPLAGFASYINSINTRYNLGKGSGQLLVGFVGNGSYPYEHAYIRYKVATNVLSIPDEMGLNNLKLFPNPFYSGLLNIDFDAKKLQEIDFKIYDLTGKIVFIESRTSAAGPNNFSFSIPDLERGIYQFVVGDFAQKLVVK